MPYTQIHYTKSEEIPVIFKTQVYKYIQKSMSVAQTQPAEKSPEDGNASALIKEVTTNSKGENV
jgi:hypothetical protein